MPNFMGASSALGSRMGPTQHIYYLKMLGIGAGDEVITVANTWIPMFPELTEEQVLEVSVL